MIDNAAIKRLHNAYCVASGRAVALSMHEMFRWEHWMLRGWTEQDLTMVIGYIKRHIKAGKRQAASLRLHLLLEPSRFEDDILDARQELRRPPPDARERILKAVGRAVTQAPARSAAQVLADAKAFEEFRQWRKTNGL